MMSHCMVFVWFLFQIDKVVSIFHRGIGAHFVTLCPICDFFGVTSLLFDAWFPDDQRGVQRASGGEPLDGRGDEGRGQGQS